MYWIQYDLIHDTSTKISSIYTKYTNFLEEYIRFVIAVHSVVFYSLHRGKIIQILQYLQVIILTRLQFWRDSALECSCEGLENFEKA